MTTKRPTPLPKLRRFQKFTACLGFFLAFATMPAAAQTAAVKPPAPHGASSRLASDIPWQTLAGKVVYIDFWASWCGPCKQSFPWMNAMQAKYGPEGLVIIAINLDQDPSKAAEFLAQNPTNFEIRYDPRGKLAEQFAVKSMPTSLILDRQGKPIVTHAGFHLSSTSVYEDELKKALSQKP
jgi:thiol-disulfide isomerase/thioredoxin